MVGVATNGSLPRATTTIRLGPAFATWAVGAIGGMLIVASSILVALGVDDGEYTIPQLALATLGQWTVMVGALAYTSHRYGTGRPGHDFATHYSLGFKPIDLVGVPIGIAAQLAIVPLLYVPLRAIWPDTFSESELEERAQELADKAHGWTVVLLVLVVVVGAPLAEELVYRGLLQKSLSAVVGAWPGLVFASLWFAVIHPSPIEYPGLFVAGLLFGAGLVFTDRIGAGIVTHAAFNATGLVLALK